MTNFASRNQQIAYIRLYIKRMRYLNTLYRWFEQISRPVRHEIVFFTFMLMMLAVKTVIELTRMSYTPKNFLCEWDYFTLSVLIAYLCTLVVYLTRSKWIRSIFFFVAFALFALCMFLLFVFGLNLSPQVMLLIGETNAKESAEFFETYFLCTGAIKTYAAMAIMLVAYIVALRCGKRITAFMERRRPKAVITLLTVVCLAWGVCQTRLYVSLFACKDSADIEKWGVTHKTFPLDTVTSLVYSIQGPRVTASETVRALALCEEVMATQKPYADTDTINVVFVLGESFIKTHSDLYGYYNPTTPRMREEQQRGNLFAFDDVVSPYNITTMAEKSIFSCNSIADGEQWFEKPIFPTIYKAAGWDVYVWDIQRNYASDAPFTFSVNAFLYNKKICDYSYTMACDKRFDYDADLVDDFFETVSPRGTHNLVVFHLMGQHVNARDRFPATKQFERFKTKDIRRDEPYMTEEKKQSIADYDNATFYNDYVIGSIIDKYRDTNTVLVYFSDHGEEMYDYRDSKTRVTGDDTANLLYYQYGVPMVVWCSDKYLQKHPQTVEHIQQALHRPAMTDNACQMFFSLSGLETPYYHPDRDLISPQYKPRKRIIDGHDYDALMRTR